MSEQRFPDALVWFRRDLRAFDHGALDAAVHAARRTWCVFVFDRDILDPLPSRADRRVEFIHASVIQLDAALRSQGGGLIVLHGHARALVPQLASQLGVAAVYAARDYEPAALARDAAVESALAADGRAFFTVRDQVVFERAELLTGAGKPYGVFTPYRNAWMRALTPERLASFETPLAGRLAAPPADTPPVPSLADLGFAPVLPAMTAIRPGADGGREALAQFRERIGRYASTRDFPAVKGPSYLSVHLRFGTVSIRELARFAWETMQADPDAADGARTWLSELVWRDFYFQVLHHHPRVVDHAFRPEFDAIRWDDDEQLFAAWCEGRTGYPLVDAAMLQLNTTGYMHNRLRMVTASFLVKDLGIDWRRGERYFADKLNDYDLAANNGGWQWAASTGCDAQPWFRIFNPVTQSRKFDPEGRFIRRYLPQLAGLDGDAVHAPWLLAPGQLERAGIRLGEDYPRPVVDHDAARQRTLDRFSVVRKA